MKLSVLGRLAARLELPPGEASERRSRRVVNGVRAAFGLVCVHRALDMAGFSILAPDPTGYAAGRLLEAVVAGTTALGILTPLSLATLLGILSTREAGPYLGLQVARMLAVGLLLAGAGRSYSFDALALRRPSLARVVRPLYVLGPPGAAGLGSVRLLLLALYWIVTFSGVRYHFFDRFWHRGDVLQLTLTMPYFCDHHETFAAVRDRFPTAFDWLCRIGLYVQAGWQALLLPLALSASPALRGFVVLQGLAFFLISTFVLNLGSLGPFELLLWVLVFGVAPRFGLDPRAPGELSSAREGTPRLVVFGLGTAAVVLFLFQSLAATADSLFHTTFAAAFPAPRALLVPFGVGRVNVFNEQDIRMGTASLVLAEADDAGRPLRVVPFLDQDGGRLDYLRNDLLYFGRSLPWQRLPRPRQFAAGPPVRPTRETRTLAREVARLDDCLTGGGGGRRYRALLVVRSIDRTVDGIPAWTPPLAVAAWEPRPEDHPGPSVADSFLGCYDLPPGHVGSGRRARATLRWVREALVRLGASAIP